mmetsp:Transcript_48936/g.116341  ORF Transcript_48936/g.116341 Transcript_48936/m.116341 type:complete len:201 (-) Transcript_48936:75-677(-)
MVNTKSRQTVAYLLQRLLDFQDVYSLRIAPQAHQPRDKLVNVNVVSTIRIKKPKQGVRIFSVNLQRREDSLHRLIRQMCLQLIHCDCARLIVVNLPEYPLDPINVGLLVCHLDLHHKILVLLRSLNGGVAEDSRHNIQDCEVGEGNVGNEDRNPHEADLVHWIDSVVPAQPSTYGLEQSKHALGQIAPIGVQRPKAWHST